jgi:hypothetical protein
VKPLAIIPAYSHLDHRLSEALVRAGVPTHAFYECSDLPKARSQLISAALTETDADVLLLIDSDIVPSVEQLCALGSSSQLDGTNAVTGAYMGRTGAWAFRPTMPGPVTLGEPGLIECTAAGLGFSAVTRASLERLAEKLPRVTTDGVSWWPFCVPTVVITPDGAEYLADDWVLWRRLSETGTRLWLDRSLVVGHVVRVVTRG